MHAPAGSDGSHQPATTLSFNPPSQPLLLPISFSSHWAALAIGAHLIILCFSSRNGQELSLEFGREGGGSGSIIPTQHCKTQPPQIMALHLPLHCLFADSLQPQKAPLDCTKLPLAALPHACHDSASALEKKGKETHRPLHQLALRKS